MSQDNLQDSGQRGPLGDYDPLYPGQLGRSLYHPEMDYNLDLIGQIIQGYRVMGTNADGSININDDTEKVLKLYKVKVTDTLLIGAGAVVDDLVWVPTDTIGSGGGPQGDQGFQGNDGPIGSQGSQGLGFQGNQGDIGPTGVQGTDGSTGAQGAQGNDGNYVIFNPTQPNSVSSSGAASMEVSFLTQAQYVTVGSILFVENTTSTLSGYVRVTSKTTSPDTFGVEWIETNINSTVGWNATTDVVLTGPEGSQGYQGDQGSQGLGFQGIKGDQGDTGVQGHQGDRGFQGYQGLGFQGIKGDQGDQGNDGPIGSQGFQGIGLQGDQGDQGNRGFQGFQGDKGFQGDQGIIGTTGAQGDQGDVGATGAQGFQGITGTTGAQGDQGNVGTTGAQGFQGITGTTGAQGDQGNVGATGAQGFQGDVGATGGSSGRTYFFNDSVIEVAGIKQLGLEPTGGAERIVSISAIQNTDTIIESYISEPFDFNSIPGGVQRFFLWASKSALNDDVEIFVQLHITDNAGTVLATAGTSQPVNIGWNSNSTTAVIHETDITFPTTSVAIGQRMKIEVIARNNDNQNHTTRFYTEGAAHYSYVVTSVGAATGAQGFQGDQGPKGDQGFQGITGTTGAQGDQGNVGATGAQGFQGITGTTGATGAQGDQGNVGATGAQGFQGITGTTGDQGDQGNVGATGAQGDQGNIGATGAQGDQGNVGATGAQGDQGNVGAIGAQGDQGNVGATGAQGDQGNVGATGAQGFQGNDGSAAISNNVNNNVLTATGTSTINGEGQMTFDGSKLLVSTDVVGGTVTTLTTAVIDGGITNVLPEFGWDQQEWVSGEILSAQTSGASVLYGAVVYLENDKMWYNADNTALIPSSSMLGIALNTTTGSGDLDVLLKGFVATEEVEDPNANHGRPMYLRSNVPGGMSDIIPTTVGEYVRIVGYVFQNQTVNGFILRFDPDKTWIEL